MKLAMVIENSTFYCIACYKNIFSIGMLLPFSFELTLKDRNGGLKVTNCFMFDQAISYISAEELDATFKTIYARLLLGINDSPRGSSEDSSSSL